jgi:penicillin amidase
MKRLRAVVALVLAAAAFWALGSRHGTFPALGPLLDPFAGFWRNGDRSDEIPEALDLAGLREEVRVAWDERHVPHIFARNDHDLFLAQGYVAATLRLWQMDFQSRYTAGRISEIVGRAGLRQDIFNRRFGLPAAAERALAALRADSKTWEALQAFTIGVNAHIRSLRRRDLPVEFKILGYEPEPWTELKCALLLKAMSYSLTAYNMDAAMTRMRDWGSDWAKALERLFPFRPPLVDPVIPPGTPWDFTPVTASGINAGGPEPAEGGADAKDVAPERSARTDPGTPPAPAMFFEPGDGTRPALGSNNWAVSGRLARDGAPILCNDMHLELSLPAVWYEIQLAAPGLNVRGVAFPATPLVIAGYNDDVAWGFTNGTDDVVDWYDITFKDATRAEYLFGGEWLPIEVREERIEVRGGGTVVDKVVSTRHGPIVRWPEEPAFPNMNVPAGAALRWLAHDPSNEFTTLDALNRAKGYDDYVDALKSWACPAQNFAYADRDGTIALWHNGAFPLRRRGQGRFVLDGAAPSDDWGGWVPRDQVPHVKDPARGFVSSANQAPADESYPYYLGWDYASFERGARINEILGAARDVTPEDMVRMQTDVVDVRARAVLPVLLEVLRGRAVTDTERRCAEALEDWNCEARASSVAPTVFRQLWNEIHRLTWDDETTAAMGPMSRPASQVLVDLMLNEPDAPWFDDRATPERESFPEIAVRALREAAANLEKRLGPFGEGWRWGRVKGTQLRHLARIPGFGRKLEADGVSQVIDAIDAVWGPSWRMVVELGPEVRAWGNFPGGQSGEPGSKFYDDRVDDWAAGRPYELVFLRSADDPDPRIVGRTVMRGTR